nr:(3s,6e)-nerolidol synthase 1 [Quercus suber]
MGEKRFSKWARLCNAFLLEAQWFVSGNLPKAEEYMKNAHVSTGLHVVLIHMFFSWVRELARRLLIFWTTIHALYHPQPRFFGFGMILEVPRNLWKTFPNLTVEHAFREENQSVDGLAKLMQLAKNQPLNRNMWTAACLTEPSMSDQRVELTKPISLVYVIDDNFDIYGTLDELTLFTNVVNQYVSIIEQYNLLLPFHHAQLQHLFARRWEFAATKQLLDSLKWARLCNAFLLEAQWFASGNLSKAEEYLKNALVSTGLHVVLVHMFFLLGQGIVKETVNLLDSSPSIQKQLLGYGMTLEVPREHYIRM